MADVSEELEAAAQARREAEEALADLQARVDNAQQLANMGDYDWHIATDTNRWSDQLYRIFGYEPQARNMDYATYMSHCHPDDRERITAIHQHAYATGEPYRMTHRITRPDGEVRYLLCNGEVVTDDSGTPTKMRGTAVDITERVHAEQERERHAAREQEERMRRRAALEINDNVVQGLTAAIYALEVEDPAVSTFLRKALDSARHMVTDLVTPLAGDDLTPGDLVRTSASTISEDEAAQRPTG